VSRRAALQLRACFAKRARLEPEPRRLAGQLRVKARHHDPAARGRLSAMLATALRAEQSQALARSQQQTTLSTFALATPVAKVLAASALWELAALELKTRELVAAALVAAALVAAALVAAALVAAALVAAALVAAALVAAARLVAARQEKELKRLQALADWARLAQPASAHSQLVQPEQVERPAALARPERAAFARPERAALWAAVFRALRLRL